jgi:tetratricopeptide (TPR) repeat protein
MALVDQSQSQTAIPQLARAITLEPANAVNYAYLGLAYGMSNQCPQAIPYFQKALTLDANNSIAAKGMSDCQAGNPIAAPAPVIPPVPILPPSLLAK